MKLVIIKSYLIAYWVIFHAFFRLLIFSVITKKIFKNTIRMSNSLGPDQARRFVGPDLGLNCLPRLSADNTCGQRVNKSLVTFI